MMRSMPTGYDTVKRQCCKCGERKPIVGGKMLGPLQGKKFKCRECVEGGK